MANNNMEIIDSDVLIIGSGLTGLRAAVEISKMGKKPFLVSKASLGKATNTMLAGGLFASATDTNPVDVHIKKTLQAGRNLNNRELVNKLANEAPAMVKELQEMGIEGLPHPSGLILRTTSLVGGLSIPPPFIKACRELNVKHLDGIFITDLITSESRCCGAIGFHKGTGNFYGFRSKAVLLATGGAGGIYARNDNAAGITGDGYILGMEAGLEIIDIEFVQFYPLIHARSSRDSMLIPPAFADLGQIKNRLGEDLKEKYDLHEKPIVLVSRDRLAQVLFKEISMGNDVDGGIYLDLVGVDDATLPFKEEVKESLKRCFSYHEMPIKIAPASHHTMGGIPVDVSCRTAMKGLFAAGEVVGGIHGANRMGGNALTECLVFSTIASRSAVEYANANSMPAGFEAIARERGQRRFELVSESSKKPSNARSLMNRLKQLLWEKAGIIRDESSLKQCKKDIDSILEELEAQRGRDPQDLRRILECHNAALTGNAICIAALERTETRGSHFRTDYPQEDEGWIKHIHVHIRDGRPQVSQFTPADE